MHTAKNTNTSDGGIVGRIALSLFFSIFFFVGLTVFCSMVSDLYKDCTPYFWDETPCQVISSKIIKIKKSDDEFRIKYSYRYKNRDYTSRRFDISDAYQDDEELRQNLRKYPAGLKTKCYVNPDSPREAVLHREIDWLLLPFLIVPLLFMGVGGGAIFFAWYRGAYINSSGIIATLSRRQKARDHVYLVKQKSDFDISEADSEVVLKSKNSSLLKFLGTLIFTLFWWFVLSSFLNLVVKGWIDGKPSWFLTIFIIPFVIAGITVILKTIYFFAALFTPGVTVTISNPQPQLGEKVVLGWRIPRFAAINKLTITLKGEEAAVSNNNNNQNPRNTFVLQNILNTDNQEAIRAGKTQFSIPLDSMHSFDGQNNKVSWQVMVHGQIKLRPDLRQEYAITVMPLSQELVQQVLHSSLPG